MGVLHKLVFLLSKLDPHNQQWKQQQINTIQFITDPKLETEIIHKIEESFAKNELDYGRKLYLIQNCIYGVDIQPIAIQIAKLRFFISLLVDEKSNTNRDENFGIDPLPNLETKLIAVNTLLALTAKQGQLSITSPEIEKYENQIFEIRKKHFSTTHEKEKKLLQTKDYELRQQLKELLTQNQFSTDDTHKIASWDPYNTNASADWFDPEWMFGVKDGFDIVIGNPPYIQLQKAFNQKIKYADLYKEQKFKTFERTGDIYCLFYEKGIQLLKPNGLLCYITSNKWMRAGYGESLRKFFLQFNPKILIDLGPNVFENATVDTNIIVINKQPNQNELLAVTITETKKDGIDFTAIVKEKAVTLNKLTKDAWFIGSNAEQRLKEKIERIGKPLKDWDVKIYRGILTGLNEAFIITTKKRNEILANCKTEEERRRTEVIIKPILRGRDIKRYYYEWAGLWVIVIPAGWTNENKGKKEAKKFIQESFPSLMQHLKLFEEKAKRRDDQGDYWWELRHCAYYPEFEKEKVFFKAVGRNLTFAKVEPGIMLTAPASFLTGKNLNYILGFLCSKFTNYFVEQNSDKTGAGDIMLNVQSFEKIPLPPITPSNQPIVSQIEVLVDKILTAKKQNPQADISHWEREIDQLVYELYGLTEEEIKIVEGE